ncbi:uncharacterized protein EI97DRAFT_469819 [Westerdykella ornata]|uniref:Uncharacterized protein n=1 Tax=Westerdykella ornata TaxID=318751 RepID=A0A6A6JA06_WESOR|nr:uncharacterized protein EI97DRAFT_469819 [Westerdykella ornata]KAF2273064.1 hypothetical protein EI97DRAFT_469819 [Westerdykella ornata]
MATQSSTATLDIHQAGPDSVQSSTSAFTDYDCWNDAASGGSYERDSMNVPIADTPGIPESGTSSMPDVGEGSGLTPEAQDECEESKSGSIAEAPASASALPPDMPSEGNIASLNGPEESDPEVDIDTLEAAFQHRRFYCGVCFTESFTCTWPQGGSPSDKDKPCESCRKYGRVCKPIHESHVRKRRERAEKKLEWQRNRKANLIEKK